MSLFRAIPALTLTLWACNSQPLTAPHPRPDQETGVYVDVAASRELDLLFMIDNSGSMRGEQENLARNAPAFIDELRKLEGGLPDVHIGVVTSDVGAGPRPIGSCVPGGQRAVLQGADRGCGLDPGSRFIAAGEGERTRNYQGDLAQVFGCLAQVGTAGCGFEHQLQAIRLAVRDDVVPQNRGFLRASAHLGIILITDEDDCSADPTSDLFGRDFPGEEAGFRCARFGHVCDGRMPPAADFRVPIASCRAAEGGPLLDVVPLADEIRALKRGPQKILVAGIFGSPGGGGDYRVGRSGGGWDYQPTCASTNGEAAAGLRLEQFVEAFGDGGSVHSICEGDFRPALTKIAEALRVAIDQPVCLPPSLADTSAEPGMQADCRVSDGEEALPTCQPGGRRPCWRAVSDDERCQASGFRLAIDRDQIGPAQTRQVIKCLTCARPDDPRCRP